MFTPSLISEHLVLKRPNLELKLRTLDPELFTEEW